MLRLSDELNDTTGLLDLLLSKAADPAGADDQRDLRETALSEDLGVTEREEVKDGDGVLLLTLDVGVTGLLGDERPELVEVDDGLPEVGLLLVEVSHTNLSEVTGMVLVHVGTVVVLTTSKTTTTGMLAVLSDTSLTGGNVAAAEITSQSITCSNIFYTSNRFRRDSSWKSSRRQRAIIVSSSGLFQLLLTKARMQEKRTRSLSTTNLVDGEGDEDILLAGLRQTGRHGDGCG
jgi:hypothetical protein